MRSPVFISNGCAPVLVSYSAITLLTSSMSAVAGSYSRRVVSPRDENVSIFAFIFGLLRDVHVWPTEGTRVAGLDPRCDIAPIPSVVKLESGDAMFFSSWLCHFFVSCATELRACCPSIDLAYVFRSK